MTLVERWLGTATRTDARGPAAASRHGAGEELSWEAAIRLFVEGWAADNPGIRPATLGHYREQVVNRIAAFAEERGIGSVQDFSRHELRAFAVWLDSFMTANGKPLSPCRHQPVRPYP